MRVAVSGASGFVGGALVRRLRAHGHEVFRLVRRSPQDSAEIGWNPAQGKVDLDRLAEVDGVVNLAGAGIGDKRWTAAYKRTLYESHVGSARTMAEALAACSSGPRVLVSVGAMGYYGRDNGGARLTEDCPAGADFAARIVVDKERATAPAADAGIRVVLPRMALIMDASGSTLGRRLLPLAKLGLLGKLGDGSTVWSVVSLDDATAALEFLLTSPDAEGPFNVSAPEPTTNAEFTTLLGKSVNRPTVLPVPKFALGIVLGELSEDILASFSVDPSRIIDAGFEFQHPDAASVIEASLASTG